MVHGMFSRWRGRTTVSRGCSSWPPALTGLQRAQAIAELLGARAVALLLVIAHQRRENVAIVLVQREQMLERRNRRLRFPRRVQCDRVRIAETLVRRIELRGAL